VLISFSCTKGDRNFSQYPGFAEYFEKHPPGHELPLEEDRTLLAHFRPRFFVPDGQKPIDFYRDYIAQGILKDAKGRVISRRVTQALLNKYKNDPGVVFVHVPTKPSGPPVVYGRITRETITFRDAEKESLYPAIFLTYQIVFRTSGLPAGITGWKEWILGVVGDLQDWHQLDHYTSVSIVLNAHNLKPFAVMMQQHNNIHTYLVGEGISIPADSRVEVDVAIRSNELYPHKDGRIRHRAVAMPDRKGLRYLITGKDSPLFSGDDITESIREVDYELSFLRPDDAFYTFKGFLGERRCVPGRDSPPGAEYNTIPDLKPMPMQLFSGYWREDDPGDIERFKRTVGSGGSYREFARLQGGELFRRLKAMENANLERADQ